MTLPTPFRKSPLKRLTGPSLLKRYLELKLREYQERYPDVQDADHCWLYLSEGVHRCVLNQDWGKY